METDSAEVRMRFGGYSTVAQSMEDGFTFPPPSTWIYRGKGRIERARNGTR